MTDHKLFGNLFLSAGAMKAGTTWLYAVLDRHPDLHFTLEKEIHYFYHRYVDSSVLSDKRRLDRAKSTYLGRFDPDRANIDRIRLNLHWTANYLDRPVDDFWYRNLFTYPRREAWGCDFSNLYALLPTEAWPKIAANCSQLRVLYTLRHPLKRLWSHAKFHLQVTDQLHMLDTWTKGEIEAFVRQPFIWDNAEYGAALRRMKTGLAPEQIMAVFFEDIRKDARAELAGIEDFLGIRRHHYSDELLGKTVNESVARPMPAFFEELFAKDLGRISAEVQDAGLTLPQSWG